MQKKFTFLLITTLLVMSFTVISSSAATISPALEVISKNDPIKITGLKGNDIHLTKKYLSKLLNCQLLSEVTITNLPDSDAGVLMVGDRPVSIGDKISGRQFNDFIFRPVFNGSSSSAMEITAVSSGICYSVSCQLFILDRLNFSPVINTSEEYTDVSTFENVSIYSSLSAVDPENDSVTYRILKYPEKGILTLTDKNGGYSYHPYPGSSGYDSFTAVAIDCYGNISSPAEISISIDKLSKGTVYSDMSGHPNEYAASLLSELGVFSGERLGDSYFFRPDKEVNMGEFISYAMAFSSIPHSDGICTDCFSSGDEKNDGLLTGYYHKAKELGYISPSSDPNSKLTFGQAVCIINKICNYDVFEVKPVFQYDTPIFTEEAIAINTLLSVNPNVSLPLDPENCILTRGCCAQLIVEAIKRSY